MRCACAEKLLGLADRLLKLCKRGIGQARQVARLIDQRRRLVLQHLDLIVDLLQLARGGQDVLRVVGRDRRRSTARARER